MDQEKRWEPQSPLVTAPELPELAARYPVLVIHCGAVWNRNDIGLDKNLQVLRHEFAPKIGVYALDIDDEVNWQFLRDAPVLNIPALVVFIKGEQKPAFIGARSEDYMREHFHEWLALADAPTENARA